MEEKWGRELCAMNLNLGIEERETSGLLGCQKLWRIGNIANDKGVSCDTGRTRRAV